MYVHTYVGTYYSSSLLNTHVSLAVPGEMKVRVTARPSGIRYPRPDPLVFGTHVVPFYATGLQLLHVVRQLLTYACLRM